MIANPDCRLITLVGPGGSGKTRVATEAARKHGSTLAHGAVFVALAPLESAGLSISTVATTLNFTLDSHTKSLTQLLRYLRGQEMLLVLDNFEHLLASFAQPEKDTETNAAIDLVNGVLTEAADVMLLVTSRERLNLQGEWVYDVGGLETPPEELSTEGHVRPQADGV